MFTYPDIDPIAFELGPLPVRWYGLMYLIGFALGWLGVRFRARRPDSPISPARVDDLVFYVALGVIAGGRIGYMLFYNLSGLVEDPGQQTGARGFSVGACHRKNPAAA